ncbi:MAG: hypothetical protein JRJ57_02360 [Deltaproteobacteria bacterium]|nr:hypothetical protein [Deltaproteobacteria bacterium]
MPQKGGKMERDLRYKMRHIGDAFVDKVEDFGLSIKDSVRGIVLTYKIDELKEEKEKIVNRIGKRMVALRNKESGQNLIYDDVLTKLFHRLDKIQDNIHASFEERKKRLYPNKT